MDTRAYCKTGDELARYHGLADLNFKVTKTRRGSSQALDK